MPSPARLTRRSLLTGAAALSSFAILPSRSRGAGGTPFTLGVASGDPTPDGFVLWTRLALQPLAPDGGIGDPATVAWEVATDAGMQQVVRRGETSADPRLAHAVHIEVADLAPNRPYWYRFTALGEQSPIGRTRTAPAPGDALAQLRFAAASCSNYEAGYFSAYRHMAAENPDLVLFLGDYIYEYNAQGERAERAVRKHATPEPFDLPGYRARYAQYRTDPDLQALHAVAPCLVTWDDHEVENDYSNQWSQQAATDPQDFLRRRAAAYRAFYEHMPLRRTSFPDGPDMRIYGRRRFGSLVEFAVLDGRQYRSAPACPTPTRRGGRLVTDAACTDRTDPSRSMLGMAQEAWLIDGFRRAETRWNVIANDLLAAPLRLKNDNAEALYWTDGWEGYPACRARVLDAVQQSRLANPVFLAGDIHAFFTTDIKLGLNTPTVATEFVGTSISSEGPSYERFARALPDNPQIHFFESRRRGYLMAELTAARLSMRMQAVSDARDPHATLSTLRSWVVEDGRLGATEA